jgi:hypothetical protein
MASYVIKECDLAPSQAAGRIRRHPTTASSRTSSHTPTGRDRHGLGHPQWHRPRRRRRRARALPVTGCGRRSCGRPRPPDQCASRTIRGHVAHRRRTTVRRNRVRRRRALTRRSAMSALLSGARVARARSAPWRATSECRSAPARAMDSAGCTHRPPPGSDAAGPRAAPGAAPARACVRWLESAACPSPYASPAPVSSVTPRSLARRPQMRGRRRRRRPSARTDR